ncbi:gag-pol polyprotein [Trifolium medium]|uniref:Gag-pol polyprotein n=1 Tax=Trifolium medium TaxID=97028 RepID=A0A392MVE6_9FABA|nr:gag-pol polyprotein [Trifolium medium]
MTNHVINTIAGGFSGGGESNSARKKYVRQVNQIAEMIRKISFPKTPELTFSERDAEGIVPHDNDPLVIQVQIFSWNIKRVLVDSGSSADIMYWPTNNCSHTTAPWSIFQESEWK